MSEEIRRETERDFDDMASAHARKSDYPWKRSCRDTDATWTLTTSDACPAPARETQCWVMFDTDTAKVLLATFKPLPELKALFDFVCPCPSEFASYESAEAAMAAAELVYERELDAPRA